MILGEIEISVKERKTSCDPYNPCRPCRLWCRSKVTYHPVGYDNPFEDYSGVCYTWASWLVRRVKKHNTNRFKLVVVGPSVRKDVVIFTVVECVYPPDEFVVRVDSASSSAMGQVLLPDHARMMMQMMQEAGFTKARVQLQPMPASEQFNSSIE